MATPDYDPDAIVTPPPGPGNVNDLGGDPTTTSGGGSGGGDTGVNTGTDPIPAGTHTSQNIPNQGYGGSVPELEMGGSSPYVPQDVPIPYVPDFDLKEVEYKPPPLPTMPEVDQTKTPAPEKNLEPMTNLIPGGDTQAINEDWRAIAANAPGVTAEQTVQGQLQQLFREGSPLLEYARGIGLQYANSRGLINSDIAGQSGAMALYNQAIPIATADAQIFARRAEQEAAFWQNAGLQAQAANFQSRLQAQAHVEQMREMALQGDINARLQLQQFGYNWDLNEQQNIHRMELAAFEGKVQAKLNLQQLGIDVERLRVDWGYRVQANDQELRNALVQSKFEDDQLVQRITQQHMNNIREIQEQGYQQRMRDDANNRAQWELEQDRQEWQSGENAADRQARADEEAARRAQQDQDREDRQNWEDQNREDSQQHQRDIQHEADVNAWMSQYVTAVDRLGTNLTTEIMTIMNNPNMTASQQQHAARLAWDRYVNRFNDATEMYRGSSLWDPNYSMPDRLDFSDVYSGSSGSSGTTSGGAGSQPSTPANPDGITGGSTQGHLDDQPVSFRNQWEASGYDLQQSGDYWIAVSPSGRQVVWHERTQQWVDPNHHQYRNDFPGLNGAAGSSPGSGSGTGDPSYGWDEGGQNWGDNSGDSYREDEYGNPVTYQQPATTSYQAPTTQQQSYSYMEPTAQLYNTNTMDNPLYSRNSLYSDRYFR